MSRYTFPVTVEPNGIGGYMASFKDVPEALTEAETLEELKPMALDALITAIDFYIEDGRAFPTPSKDEKAGFSVTLPPSVVAKILLLNAMVETNTRPVDLARKMGISRQQVSRLTNLHHATKIDLIAEALSATGKTLEVSAL